MFIKRIEKGISPDDEIQRAQLNDVARIVNSFKRKKKPLSTVHENHATVTSDELDIIIKQSSIEDADQTGMFLDSIIDQLSASNVDRKRPATDEACDTTSPKIPKYDDAIEHEVEYPHIDKLSFVTEDYSTNTDQWLK